jgi:predicted enzyme related to lactoylglutathione lyase
MEPLVLRSRLVTLTFDASDPRRVAAFWAEALGWRVGSADDDDVELEPDEATAFSLLFQRVPEPKVVQNRTHLDLTTSSVDDQADTVARLLAAGGRHVDIGQGPEETHVVLADPEGNELCIIGPGNNFLAGCPRLGAVNCDGTARVGHFWSEVFGWPLVWDQDEETAIREPHRSGPLITWSGPPLMPKPGKNRVHFDIAPPAGGSQDAEVERLLGLGATRLDIGQGDVSWVVMADPDGNEFCVLTPR